MQVSKKKFVIIFLVSAFAFQFITNSLLGPKVQCWPVHGEWFPGMGSPVAWKNILAHIIYPVKFILIGPLTVLGQDPDPPPPLLPIIFTLYWTVMALVLYFLLSKIFNRKK
ncbi:MAG: hypothetical protein HYX40_03470 [Sphingobacteriales bacterium]|nr:hypothetical protein [Sphingobacteriales bacterium]